MRPGYILLAAGIIAACFCAFLGRPYSVLSDVGYQALSARQYVGHYTAFNSIRLVDPHDLAKDVVVPLTAWTPCWPALFVLAFQAGLSVGKAGRLLAFLISLVGAIGWVYVISMVGLKGRWRLGGIVLAALYCLRTGSVTAIGAGDQIIYAVAPWLIAAAAPLAVSLYRLPGRRDRQLRVATLTVLLALALGLVYWLKYSGIFLSIAILAAVLIEQFRGFSRTRIVSAILLLAVYGAAFLTPVLGLKAYNYRKSGSDFIESAAPHSPPRDVTRLVGFVTETAFNAATILFSTRLGTERIAGERPGAFGWLIRAPGLALLVVFFFLTMQRPPGYIRNVTILAGAVPLIGFPALSFATGPHFTFAIGRCCDPYWILVELLILALLSQSLTSNTAAFRSARACLAVAAACQIAFLLWIPYQSAREAWKIFHTPPYQTSAAELWDTDLSKYGTRDIDANVSSLIRHPNDIVVPAIYSNRGFAADTLLEFGGRLLPLSDMLFPFMETHGRDGANYRSSAPFVSSGPLRIVLVAPDPYSRADFQESTQRIMRRFAQVTEWTPGPVDPHGRVWIWTGEITEPIQAPAPRGE